MRSHEPGPLLDDDPEAWSLAVAEPAEGAIAVVAARQPGISLKGFSLT